MSEKQAPNIYQRILGVMSELDYVAKGDKTVNGQYRFVSHDQVTAKIHPMLVKYGIVALPTVEEMSQEGNRTFARIVISFINVDNPTDNFAVRYCGQGIDQGDKGPGKAISYAVKYALLKVFCLETGDDPDNDANASYEPAKCHQFDLKISTELTDKEQAKMKRFLEYCANVMNKHVEDVKREAMQRPEDFLTKFKNWNPKKDKDA